MAGDLTKLNNLLAAVDTHRDIAAQQRSAVEAGFQFATQRTLAQEIASFDRSRLRHVERTTALPEESEFLREIRTFDRSKLKSAQLREANPPPSCAPSSLDIGSILNRISSKRAQFLASASELVSSGTPEGDWDTD